MNPIVLFLLLYSIHAVAFSQAKELDQSVEQLLVTAEPPDFLAHFESLQVGQKIISTQVLPAQNPVELLLNSPDVALNGQGGMLQMYSIRGLSRWRVQTSVEGVPIFTDRRAGSTASFVPSVFIEQVDIIPGAASSTFGTGAMGGAVNIRVQQQLGHQILVSHNHLQDSINVGLTSSTEFYDIGLSYRDADMSQDANGAELNDGVEHFAGMWRHKGAFAGRVNSLLLVSEGNDWGKSSSRFSESRRTNYPVNDHILFKTQVQLGNILIEPYVHRADLQTNIQRSESLTNSNNSALNYGVSARRFGRRSGWRYNWRAGLRARRNVKATEAIFDNQSRLLQSQTTLSGQEQEVFFSGDLHRLWQEINWLSGMRLNYTRLTDTQHSMKTSDGNWSAYTGARWALNPYWSTGTYVSTAYRTPVLTELFFTGETPRGQVFGDPDLDSENALNFEYDIDYRTEHFSASVNVYYQQIRNYIERLEIDSDIFRYQNLDRADIWGLSYRITHTALNGCFHTSLRGQWLSGEDKQNNALVDISPNHHTVSFTFERERMSLQANINHRMRKGEVASGEQPLPSHNTIDLMWRWQLNNQWHYRMTIKNMTNKLAHSSADEFAPYIAGRNVTIELGFLF